MGRRLGNTWRWYAVAALCMLIACASTREPKPPTYPALPQSSTPAPRCAVKQDLGGRLFDNFWKVPPSEFVPDDPATPEPDGQGGPFGNGTLPGADGKPMLNTGHDYRLLNLLGSDLHGKAGITGRAHAESDVVLLPDLLKNNDSVATWEARLTRGEDAIPAYGSVLSPAQITALTGFLLGVRDGELPLPDDLFILDEDAPGFYRLQSGGNAARGHTLIAQQCAQCHGSDGTKLMLGSHSLGTFLRSRANEAWLKILNGAPNGEMPPQLPCAASRSELTQTLRDLLAAGCDRLRYPRGNAPFDVADGDARCGHYLK